MVWQAILPVLNGFAFAKICHELLGLDLLFFFYSDMQKEKLFIHESGKILQNMQEFNGSITG